MRDTSRQILYPSYFDSKCSRRKGRRVRKKLAVEEPTAMEIVEAARPMGLNPIIEPEKRYPKCWWKKKGRILVDNKDRKTAVIHEIAARLKENRESGTK